MSRTQLGLRLSIPAVVVAVAIVAIYTKGGPTPPTVTTAQVTWGDILQTVAASGTLEAVTTVTVGTQVSGTVAALFADYNDIVRKGQVLAKLDSSLLQAQVEQASAGLAKAHAGADQLRVALEDAVLSLARATTLRERQLLSTTDFDTASYRVRTARAELAAGVAQVTQAQATVNQSRVNHAHSIITAPIDGVVIARSVDAGQTVAASMSSPTLFVLAGDLTQMRVNAKLDESDIGLVTEGMTATFQVDAYPNDTFTGRVSQVRLQGEVVSNVVTYVTVIEVANPDLRLKPGMTASVKVEVARRSQALRVPNGALRLRPTAGQLEALGLRIEAPQVSPRPAGATRAPSVWRSIGGRLERVPIQTGISDGAFTEVLPGRLMADDTVATAIVTAAKTTGTAGPLAGTTPRGRGGGLR